MMNTAVPEKRVQVPSAPGPLIAPVAAAEFEHEDLVTINCNLTKKIRELQAEVASGKAAKRRAEQLERRLETIVNYADQGIYELDLQGTITFVNSKAAQLLGWRLEELRGKPAHETIHCKHADGREYGRRECPIHAAMPQGGTHRVTNDLFWRKDGSSFRVECLAAPTEQGDGRISGTIVIFRDITEQVAGDARLKLQEQQYRLLFQANPNAMWVCALSTFRILAVNDAAIAQYGYAGEEFLKLTLPDLRAPEEKDKLVKIVSLPESPTLFRGEFEHVRKDGSRLYVEVHSSPVVWEGVSSRMVTAIDYTKRKEAEASLRERTEMLDHTHDAIIVHSLEDCLITLWNKGAERLYGWTANEAIGRPVHELILAESSEIETGTEVPVTADEFRGEVKTVTKDKREVVVEVRSTLIADSDGKPRSILSIHTDVAKQKKLEQRLRS